MKKLAILALMAVLMCSVALGATLTRTIEPSSASSGDTLTITYTISGANSNYGGIIYETAPTGFTWTTTSFANSFDVAGKKITGQLLEIPFAGTADGQYAVIDVVAGSSSGLFSTGYVEWAEGAGTDQLSDVCVEVDGAACNGGTPPPSNGDDSAPVGMTWVYVAGGLVIVWFLMNKK